MIYHHQHCWPEEYLELDTWLLMGALDHGHCCCWCYCYCFCCWEWCWCTQYWCRDCFTIAIVWNNIIVMFTVVVVTTGFAHYCHHPDWNHCYVMFVSRHVFFIIIIIKSYSTNQHLFNIISVQSREPQTSMIYTPYRKKTNNNKKSSMTTPLFNKIIKHLPPVRSIPSAKVFKWGSCIRTTSGGRW